MFSLLIEFWGWRPYFQYLSTPYLQYSVSYPSAPVKDASGAGEVAQWVKCLLCQDESLSLDPQLYKKLGMVMVTHNPYARRQRQENTRGCLASQAATAWAPGSMRHCLKTNVASTKERYPRATSGLHICTLRHMFLQLLTRIYTMHFLVCMHITLTTCTNTHHTYLIMM